MHEAERAVYERLASRLDAIPNGFPRTESGVELEILARLFRPEEATLAAAMRLRPEPAAAIAERVGVGTEEALQRLKDMARRGLILARHKEGELQFGLLPWVVGIYEAQLPRMDAELARLVEQYFQEAYTQEALRVEPAFQRVIPVQEAVPTGIEIAPYQQVQGILAEAKSFGVRDCICRVQRRLAGHPCDHPVENCLVFSPYEHAFDHAAEEGIRPLTREEAYAVLAAARDAGLVHTVNNVQGRHGYICNCCTCSCGLLRGIREFGIWNAVARSPFRSRVDADLCIGCGDCVERCQFGALSLVEDVCQVDWRRCLGCGQCVLVCPSGALRLEPRPPEEVPEPPKDRMEWMMQRAKARGLSLRDMV
ncbi:MAG: 4Fe-4S binding protein [Anaerolineae bacterium]